MSCGHLNSKALVRTLVPQSDKLTRVASAPLHIRFKSTPHFKQSEVNIQGHLTVFRKCTFNNSCVGVWECFIYPPEYINISSIIYQHEVASPRVKQISGYSLLLYVAFLWRLCSLFLGVRVNRRNGIPWLGLEIAASERSLGCLTISRKSSPYPFLILLSLTYLKITSLYVKVVSLVHKCPAFLSLLVIRRKVWENRSHMNHRKGVHYEQCIQIRP